MTVAMVTIMAMASSFGNAEHPIYASDHTANTRAECAANDASHRPCRAAAFICTLSALRLQHL